MTSFGETITLLYMLEKYEIKGVDTTNLSILESSLRYYLEYSDHSILALGLNPTIISGHESFKGTPILVETSVKDKAGFENFDRHGIDTLHDYCLFLTSPNNTGEGISDSTSNFYKNAAKELAEDLKKMKLPVPTEIWHVYGNSYPGSKSFAFEHAGCIFFT